MFADRRPAVRAEDDDSQFPTTDILLMSKALIRREYHGKSGALGGCDQLTIRQRGPSHLIGRCDLMSGKDLAHAYGHILIKQDTRRTAGQKQ
ncbi:MAG: hypothetical protein NVSMB26_14970 [Beijerinckiaceae bacterium]